MSYSIQDFIESIEQASIELTDIAEVVKAHGNSGSYNEWEGGFVLRLQDGRWLYLTGWCDTTGWGCQDGIDEHFYDAMPDDAMLREAWEDPEMWRVAVSDWEDPIDLNRLVRGELKLDKWGDPLEEDQA